MEKVVNKIQSIGIISPNFGGSTIFGSLMQGYNGIHHVGESHRILEPKNDLCREDGDKCKFFTSKVISEIVNNESNFYNNMANALGCKTIITGDKNPYYYDGKTGLTDMFIVLLKNPYAHTYSFFKRLEKLNDYDEKFRIDKIKEASEEYYKAIIDRLIWALKIQDKKNIPVYVISFEEFLKYDISQKNNLAKKMNLDTEYIFSSVSENMHYIGGNHKLSNGGSGDGKFYFKGEHKEDVRYKEVFSKDELELIKDNLDSFKLLRNHLSKANIITDINWI